MRLRALAAGLAMAALWVAPALAQKKITVLTWNIPIYEEKVKGWIADYKQIRPDVTVEWIDKKGPELGPFYQTQAAAGTPIDVVDIQGGLWLEYAAAGALLDLTPYLVRDKEMASRFEPNFLKGWQFEGKQYLVPFYITKTLLFYNKEMFKAAGIAEPPKSFDELLAQAGKMAAGEKSGFLTANFDWLYWPLFAMNGVELVTPDLKKAAFNTPKAVETLGKLAKATESGAINKIAWTGRWVEPNGAFASGTVGMLHIHAPAFFYVRGSGKWVNESTLGIATLPGGWATPNSHGWMISKASKEPDAAWDFVKLVTSKKWAATFGTTLNNLTGNVEADQEIMAHFRKTDPLAAKVLEAEMANPDKITGNWPLARDSQVKEAFYAEIQNAVLGRKSPKDALDEAERKVNRILAR
jgi:ABC-type glycerol-3-phosphate transport system substrate-binding protein